MKQAIALVLSLAITGSATAAPQTSSTGRKKTAKKSTTSVAAELQQMKQALEAQQQQILQLSNEVKSRDQAMQQMQQRLDQSQALATQAQSKADTAVSQSAQQEQAVTALKTDVSGLKSNMSSTALSLQETQKSVKEGMESPLALHYKGITITPGGFLAAETVWRGRGLAGDINTPFNTVPFPGSSQSNISEFFASGRQSRVSLLAEGKLKSAKLSGYVETDFLSAAITSNNNESNSYSLRQRQAWGQAALENGFSFTGGQMWSLVTETKKGMDNRTEAVPLTIDPQYSIGFSWARQYGFRVTKNLANKFWLGFSVENPQTTFAAHGNSSNFLIGAPGTAGGLYNPTANYSFNAAPDLVFKAVAEPGFGHYEVFGILSEFRDRAFPNETAATPSAAGAFNDKRTGGGIGANARVSFFHKHIDVGGHALAGNGVGRYGTAGLAEATVRPDGTLALIRSYQGLGTVEWHSDKLDVYLNGGGEYAARTAYLNSSGKGVGYGSPLFSNSGCFTEPLPGSGGFSPGALTSCTGDTRIIMEGTIGFWHRIYSGPKGKLQWGPQYSYVSRNTWAGTGGQPKGIDNMIFTSFRYYLP